MRFGNLSVMRRPFCSLVFSVAILASATPTTLIFVRHGETVANATGRYNSRTIDTFSALGEKQVAELTKKLDRMQFDAVVVSPSPRALRTLAPYLRAHHRQAIVVPELYECCDAHSKRVKGPTSATLRFGAKFTIPSDLRGLFAILPGHDRLPSAPSYEDGLIQIRACAERLRQAFSGRTILVVGHSLQGGRMLELLEGKPMVGRIRPGNCSITTLAIR